MRLIETSDRSSNAKWVVEVQQRYQAGPRSMARLLKDAGFPGARGQLSVPEIEQALKREPALAELWLERGSDQSIAGGWSIEEEEVKYRVRNFSPGIGLCWKDRWHACAGFCRPVSPLHRATSLPELRYTLRRVFINI
jgi:hypothetical protein